MQRKTLTELLEMWLEMVVVVKRGMFGAAQLFIKPSVLTSSASSLIRSISRARAFFVPLTPAYSTAVYNVPCATTGYIFHNENYFPSELPQFKSLYDAYYEYLGCVYIHSH